MSPLRSGNISMTKQFLLNIALTGFHKQTFGEEGGGRGGGWYLHLVTATLENMLRHVCTLSLPSHFLSYCTTAESCCSVQISTTVKHLEMECSSIIITKPLRKHTQNIFFLIIKISFWYKICYSAWQICNRKDRKQLKSLSHSPQ